MTPAGAGVSCDKEENVKKAALSILAILLAAGFAPGQYDHLTITADSLVPSLGPLCQYIDVRVGLNDTVVTVAEVYASASGRDNQEKLRNYIKQAYSSWSTTHVLLAGDDDQIPCRVCWLEVNPDYRDWIAKAL